MMEQPVNLITQVLIQQVIVAAFLALVCNRVIEAIATPVFERFKWDRWWLMYVSWAISAGLVWLSGINLFETFIPYPIAGQALTALVAGGGSNLLHEVFDALVGLQSKYNAKSLK